MSKYAQLSHGEICFVMSKKVGRTAWAVYCCLASHCQNKDWCIPSIPRITKWLDNNVNQKTIEKALKELVEKGLLVRNCAVSKRRWRLVYRMSNTSTTVKKQNTLKVGGVYKSSGSKVGTTNTLKVGTKTPSNMAPIKDKLNNNSKINSISNETVNVKEWLRDDEIEKKIIDLGWEVSVDLLREDMNTKWFDSGVMAVHYYELWSLLTDRVLDNSQKNEIERILEMNVSEEKHAELLKKEICKKTFR